MKKTLMLLAAALWAVLFCVTAHAASLGDVDGSDGITAGDARLALRTAVALEPEITPGTEAFEAADVDFNEVISAADARSILRAAVQLEDMNEHLPESEALSEKEILQKLQSSTVRVTAIFRDHSVSTGYGFAIDPDGTVILPYRVIHKAVSIEVEKEGCKVESVLYTDPAADVALIRVKGDLPCLSLNRTWFHNGERVYSVDEHQNLHVGTLAPIPAGAVRASPTTTVSAFWKSVDYSYFLTSRPLLDRFGRAIGLIQQMEGANGSLYSYAFPLSKLPAAQEYAPRTVEEFSREEWDVSLECSIEAIEISQYGVAQIKARAENSQRSDFSIFNPHPELIDAAWGWSIYDQNDLFVLIVARQPCSDIPVTLRLQGQYETLEITVRVSVTADGGVCMASGPNMPDPGVIWKCLPRQFTGGSDQIELTYLKTDTGLSGEEMFTAYEKYLSEMGYEYVKTEQNKDHNKYWFRLKDTDSYVVYTDGFYAVQIAGIFHLRYTLR